MISGSVEFCIYLTEVFEWDERKAGTNLEKHGVSFWEAVTVFADTNALDGPDIRHSVNEVRFLRLGRSMPGRILVIAYTRRTSADGEKVRIISARRASRRERAAYVSGSGN